MLRISKRLRRFGLLIVCIRDDQKAGDNPKQFSEYANVKLILLRLFSLIDISINHNLCTINKIANISIYL